MTQLPCTDVFRQLKSFKTCKVSKGWSYVCPHIESGVGMDALLVFILFTQDQPDFTGLDPVVEYGLHPCPSGTYKSSRLWDVIFYLMIKRQKKHRESFGSPPNAFQEIQNKILQSLVGILSVRNLYSVPLHHD